MLFGNTKKKIMPYQKSDIKFLKIHPQMKQIENLILLLKGHHYLFAVPSLCCDYIIIATSWLSKAMIEKDRWETVQEV